MFCEFLGSIKTKSIGLINLIYLNIKIDKMS